jgi:hypothetical protein
MFIAVQCPRMGAGDDGMDGKQPISDTHDYIYW